MLWNMLSGSNSAAANNSNGWGTWVMLLVLVGVIVVFMVFNRRTQTKRQQETMDMLNAIQPGNKVKTIGGICGVVVEVCPEDNTFVLETGTEASGKSYLKFDKQAVYQTDAVAKKPEETQAPVAPVEETVEAATEEAPVEKEESTEDKE